MSELDLWMRLAASKPPPSLNTLNPQIPQTQRRDAG